MTTQNYPKIKERPKGEHSVACTIRRMLTHRGGSSRNLLREPTCTIEELAKDGNFDRIGEILANPSTPLDWLSVCAGQNALHMLCLYQPPECIIRKVVDRLSSTCDLQVDGKGRTPLHVAADSGASPGVIRLLLGDEASTAASVLDSFGRFPIHYASRATTRQRSGKKTIETIEILLEAYPAAAIARDQYGKTPLDLALAANHDDSCIVSRLRIAGRKFIMKNTKKTSNRSNETASTLSSSQSSTSAEHDFLSVLYVPSTGHDDDVSSVGSRGISRQPHEDPIRSQLIEYNRMTLSDIWIYRHISDI